MLSIFSDMMNTATRTDRWSPPDHWNSQRAPRAKAQHERQEAERHQRAYGKVGMR